MTAALTSAGIQYFTLSIASGATSATALITGVGAGAYLSPMGQKYSLSNTDPRNSLGRMTLTDPTTVTGTLNTIGPGTLTLNGCIVDADTTNFIKSVQYGTISLSTAQVSNTAALTPVTNANSTMDNLGVTSSTSGNSYQFVAIRVSMTSATAIANRNSSGGTSAAVVGIQCREHQAAGLNSSVQKVVQTTTSGVSNASVITNIAMAQTLIGWSGNVNNTGTTGISAFKTSVKLSTVSTATVMNNADPGGGTNITGFSILEHPAALLTATAVQRGNISLAAATSGNLTISAVTQAKAVTNWLQNTTNISGINFETEWYMLQFTDTTTITMSDTASVTGIGSIEVGEFNAAAAGTAITADSYGFLEVMGTPKIDGRLT